MNEVAGKSREPANNIVRKVELANRNLLTTDYAEEYIINIFQ